MMKFHTAQWREDRASVQRSTYRADGSTSLIIKDRYGAVLCDATVCLADYTEIPARGHVFIRDWGDNQGVLHALQEAGVIGRTLRTIRTGILKPDECLVHECELLQ